MSCRCNGSMGAWGGSGPGMSGILPTFVWPSDVDEKKREIGSYIPALEHAMDACRSASAEEAIAFNAALERWRAYVLEPTGIFGGANAYDRGKAILVEIRQWQDFAETRCGMSLGPKVTPPEPDASASEVLSAVKTIALAGGVVAGVVLLAPIVGEWLAARRVKR